MEDNIKFQYLPPLKRLRLLQQQNLDDNKENSPNFSFDSSSQLPAKKRKESRHHLLPRSSEYSTFSLPAKKRVSAFHSDFFLSNPLSPFDLNVEFQSIDKLEESPSSVAANLSDEIPRPVKDSNALNLFGEIPQPVKESNAHNLFVEIPQLVKESNARNVFVEIPQPVKESNAHNLFVESPQRVKEKGDNEPVPSNVSNPLVEIPPLEEEQDVEDNDDGIVCAICQSTDGDPMDPIVFCDGCDLMVHTTCYGNPLIKGVPEGDWFCTQCSVSRTAKPNEAFTCCLCPLKTGAMKPTKDGLWAHIVCAVYVPEVFFEDPDGREGINCCEIPKRRWKEKCYICRTRKGCAIHCSEPKCGLAFHVTCGLNEDLCIEYKQGRRNEEIIVAGFCKRHTELWKKQQQTGKFKIVASKENS